MTRLSRPSFKLFSLTWISFLWFCLATQVFATEVPCWETHLPIKAIDVKAINKWLTKYERSKGKIILPGNDKRFDYFRNKKDVTTKDVRVMTWNVQQAGPDVFLPRGEQNRLEKNPKWYQKLWYLKLEMMARIIQLRQPDVLFLNEVTQAGMRHLMKSVFKPLGYTHYYFDVEGHSSKSGFGNAVVTKEGHTLFNIESHGIVIHDVRPPTRNILRVQIKIGNKLVTFLGIHFKSRLKLEFQPAALNNITSQMIRQQQVIKLLEIIRDERAKGNAVVVLGDVNSPLTREGMMEPRLGVTERAYEGMESVDESLWSVTPWFTSPFLNRVREASEGHNPFAEIDQATYVWNDFIPIPGTSRSLPDGTSRPKFRVNKYPYKFDYIVVYPHKDSLVASAEPRVIVTPWHANEYGDPKSTWTGTREHQINTHYGPSDHYPVELLIYISQEE